MQVDDLDHQQRGLLVPAIEQRDQQFVAVAEVVIEASLGHAEEFRQRLNTYRIDSPLTENQQARFDPFLSPQATFSVFFFNHTLPYVYILFLFVNI